MPVHQGRIKEEPFHKSGLDVANSLPIGGAEVGAESKANLEEQVFSKDVREYSRYAGVVLDLSKAQLDIIGMDDNVIVWVQYPQVVCPTKDVLMHMAKLTLKLEPRGMDVIKLMGMESQSY